jgi:hypothetical protein
MWGFPAMVLLEAMLSLRFGWIEIVSLQERLSLGGKILMLSVAI